MSSESAAWYSLTDDVNQAWKEGGQAFAASLVPAGLIFCGSAVTGAWSPAFWLALVVFVPLAGVYTVWKVVADRGAVVEVRVCGESLTVIRADGSTAGYPVRDVERVEVDRVDYVGGVTPARARMRLRVGGRSERTRRGPDLSREFQEALKIAEVDLRVTVKRREE